MNPDAYLEMSETESSHWWFVGRRKIISSLLARLDLLPDAQILEIGCGTGGNLNMLSKFGVVHALEKNSAALNMAIKKTNNKFNIKHGYCPEAIPFEKQKFDLICIFDVLEHIEEDQDTLCSLQKYLSSNGYLVLTVPAYQWLWSAHDDYLQHKRRYTISKIIKLIDVADLVPLNISYYNMLLFPLVALIRLKDRINSNTTSSGNKIPARLINASLSHIFSFERYLLKKIRLPFGVSIVGIFKKSEH